MNKVEYNLLIQEFLTSSKSYPTPTMWISNTFAKLCRICCMFTITRLVVISLAEPPMLSNRTAYHPNLDYFTHKV